MARLSDTLKTGPYIVQVKTLQVVQSIKKSFGKEKKKQRCHVDPRQMKQEMRKEKKEKRKEKGERKKNRNDEKG